MFSGVRNREAVLSLVAAKAPGDAKAMPAIARGILKAGAGPDAHAAGAMVARKRVVCPILPISLMRSAMGPGSLAMKTMQSALSPERPILLTAVPETGLRTGAQPARRRFIIHSEWNAGMPVRRLALMIMGGGDRPETGKGCCRAGGRGEGPTDGFRRDRGPGKGAETAFEGVC